MATPLDHFDRQLLALLQEDSRMSQAELGERVNLSAAAVNRRIKRLTDEGVIERFTIQLRPDALDLKLTVIVEVVVDNDRIDLLDTMRQSFQRHPYVQQCYYVTGDCDFVIVMLVRDMDHYTTLTRELFFANNNVKRFTTLVTMDCIKTGTRIPIPVPAD
jgi:Lrp/AsnC family leucine-responsive transcriptional regulator